MSVSVILAIIGVVLVIAEVITISTFFIWIAIGFFVAAFVAIFTSNIFVITIFGIVASVASVMLLKTSYVKYVLPKKRTETAFNELIGKHAIMLEEYTSNGVDNGLARVGGVDWSVQCEESGIKFEEGQRVVIKKIEGVRLIIEREE